MQQLSLPLRIEEAKPVPPNHLRYDRLISLLSEDLDFHNQDSRYASHNFHAFPAKFPPQLPRKFITGLTKRGDVVLDPMMGSGTTILETYLSERYAIGFDIDPLALKIAQVKVTPLEIDTVSEWGRKIAKAAGQALKEKKGGLERILDQKWDTETKNFIDYWFAFDVQLELMALLEEITKIENKSIKSFFELALSAVIITKSGGVSLALDLAHTRPHRAKIVVDRQGNYILGDDSLASASTRHQKLAKTLRSPIDEFEKRVSQNLQGLSSIYSTTMLNPRLSFSNAQGMPLKNSTVDLIVTSPPYASNAIDYMRAHKFALVWQNYSVAELSTKRKEYIGGESTDKQILEKMPDDVAQIINTLSQKDIKKGRVLHRYYSEMTRVLREMFRVLKPGGSAIVVVGSSVMRDIDTKTEECLASIGRAIGFDVPKIGVRNLDRDRRMLPAELEPNKESQIQQRMHQEYVIGFYKPVC